MRDNRTLIIIVSAVLMVGYFSYSFYTLNTEDFNSSFIPKIAFAIWFLIMVVGLSKKKAKS
ncbi:MAG: hypothetical protein CUR34_07190 [Sediminibacterium sp.]|nr:MAG: hypothetical protein CUR34_07190 [Sediminibacterium sp.] [Sediminibacterium sp. FEMGT703S]